MSFSHDPMFAITVLLPGGRQATFTITASSAVAASSAATAMTGGVVLSTRKLC